MAQQAQVRSVEAIENFRAALIVFLGQARPAIEEIGAEVARTKGWLQQDRRRFWDNELKSRRRKLEEAQQELLNARLSEFQETTSLQVMAVNRLQRSVREGEEKLATVKRWDRELENRSAPMLKQAEQFQTLLMMEIPKAIAALGQMVKTLESYAGPAPPEASKPPEKTS
ncbi:MAG: hypothetical protein KGR98_03675 [Verrucomicrobia bacterium]|nr:hypothetical protein [Verrucomicrobiota bacterium]MDE3097871.1 hypothetical protein [Verrucomicrobiota bacterium]